MKMKHFSKDFNSKTLPVVLSESALKKLSLVNCLLKVTPTFQLVMSSVTGILRVEARPPVHRVHFLIRDLQPPDVCSWSTGVEVTDNIRTEIRINSKNDFILDPNLKTKQRCLWLESLEVTEDNDLRLNHMKIG